MELSPSQRRLLIQYREARRRPKSLGSLLRPGLPRLLILIALVTFAAYNGPPKAAWFVGGLAAGGVLRQLGMTIQGRRLLPLTLEIIDWAKVDRLLDGDEPSRGGGA